MHHPARVDSPAPRATAAATAAGAGCSAALEYIEAFESLRREAPEGIGSWYKVNYLRCKCEHAVLEGDYEQLFRVFTKASLREAGFEREVIDFMSIHHPVGRAHAGLRSAIRKQLEAGHTFYQ